MKQIDAETLIHWLEEGRPVSVLDTRVPEDRAEWCYEYEMKFPN